MAKNLQRVKFFLKAPNEIQLVQKQLLNNLANETEFDYDPPIKVGDKWVLWFFADASNYKAIT